MPTTLWKKRIKETLAQVFSYEFCEISQNTSGRLLLSIFWYHLVFHQKGVIKGSIPRSQDINWTYLRRSEDFQPVTFFAKSSMSYVLFGSECAFVISLDLELGFIPLQKKNGENLFIPKFTDKIYKKIREYDWGVSL